MSHRDGQTDRHDFHITSIFSLCKQRLRINNKSINVTMPIITSVCYWRLRFECSQPNYNIQYWMKYKMHYPNAVLNKNFWWKLWQRDYCCQTHLSAELVLRINSSPSNIILWRICPSLGNGSVNTFPKHTRSTIGHPFLSNGSINRHSLQQKTVFSMESVQRSYKRA
jgi:hypothetical protein